MLINRPPAKYEIYNDTDGRLVNFWRRLQKDTDSLVARLDANLWSEEIFGEALAALDSDDKTEAAWAFATVTCQRFPRQDDIAKSDYHVSPFCSPHIIDWRALASRIQQVQITRRPAEQLLENLRNNAEMDIYLDPPYYQSDASLTSYTNQADIPALAERLAAQKGRVAISGINDEWDMLGWRKVELSALTGMDLFLGKTEARAEALWCNYQPNDEAQGYLALG